MNARFFGPVSFLAASFRVDFTFSSISTATRITLTPQVTVALIIAGTLF